MRTTHKAKKLISDAADLIERDGFCHRELGTFHGPKCMLGAISQATGGSPRCPAVTRSTGGLRMSKVHYRALLLLESAMKDDRRQPALSGVYVTVPMYSDSHSKEEVLAFMREVAR